MIALLPAIFAPGEPLGQDPQLALELAGRAAEALNAACPNSTLILAIPDNQPELASPMMQRTAADELLRLPATNTAAGPLPAGTAPALLALGRQARQGKALVLDPRNPGIDADILRQARAQWQQRRADILLSAIPSENHPCQAKIVYHALQAPRPLADGIEIRQQKEQAEAVLLAAAPATPHTLDIHNGMTILRLPPQPKRPGHYPLPHGFVPCATMRWALGCETGAQGHPPRLIPLLPPDAPWHWDDSLNRVVNSLTGQTVHGRQSLPEVLEPEGSLWIVDGTFNPERDLQNKVELVVLPRKRALRITDALTLLRWRLFVERRRTRAL